MTEFFTKFLHWPIEYQTFAICIAFFLINLLLTPFFFILAESSRRRRERREAKYYTMLTSLAERSNRLKEDLEELKGKLH